uniref:Bifunctional glutamine synthetase adenylyltransferase/adenylyl-removing enzyme n=1 Tax=Candidatus Kentrum sp. DK TaxID=2126562 RepID=A0A450THM9_9GAMM|nr:MAG: glutamate-ammonia-ligase adenylyltransferase [Candidatus Kentron sp. DK]
MTLLSPPLQTLAKQRIHDLSAAEGVSTTRLRELPGHTDRVLACSDFVANTCIRNPALLSDLLESGDLARTYPVDHYRQRCRAALSPVSSEEELLPILRKIRQREMVRIAWRDLAGMAALDETVRDLSAFADAIIDGALDKLHGWSCQRFGVPHSEAGDPQRLVVLGMGKLGGEELNFSSDVDLIFCYPSTGHTRFEPGAAGRVAKRNELSNEEFFIRLGRGLIRLLGQKTEDGLVFRVDMRLRPFGASGPLAGSFDALEDYYQIHGRDWERYALIRARPVAGDIAAGNALLERLRPFIYRRYLDFGAIDALREMKALIAREGQRKGDRDNVKTGPGGIREIEFLAQALQMIHGGRAPDLRARPTLVVLLRLGGRGHLAEPAVKELSEAYRFLRAVEHRLQEVDDQQTHHLPEDESERERIAIGMGFGSWADLFRELERRRNNVQQHFDDIFAPVATPDAGEAAGRDTGGDRESDPLDSDALLAMDDTQGIAALGELGFSDAVGAWEIVRTLDDNSPLRFLTERGRARLKKLLPLVLHAAASRDGSRTTLARIFQVLEAIGRRSVYFSLLVENPVALEQLVRLCAASPWIARQIAHFPLLLDELLSPEILYAPPNIPEMKNDLAVRFAVITPGDTEQEMDALRQFKQANVLRIAAADVCRVVPLMVVSDHLTNLAKVCLDAVLDLAWRDLVKRHGDPGNREGEHTEGPDVTGTENSGFLIVAYGKLGGIELGYGSDLDLVFLYDGAGDPIGEKRVERGVFFARLGQRIIHYLAAGTAAGMLYEVDARLRPSGRSGFLVSNMDAFTEYQRNDAWTWEHQALARARPVAGDLALARRFEAVRAEILHKRRNPERLRAEVREMREKMRRELDRGRKGIFDLKQGAGGITDIEFLVQYGVLRWADRLGEGLRYTDNIRLLEGMANAGVMAREDADLLADAYRSYRATVHALALEEREALVEETGERGNPGDKTLGEGAIFAEERALVSRIWGEFMEES